MLTLVNFQARPCAATVCKYSRRDEAVQALYSCGTPAPVKKMTAPATKQTPAETESVSMLGAPLPAALRLSGKPRIQAANDFAIHGRAIHQGEILSGMIGVLHAH